MAVLMRKEMLQELCCLETKVPEACQSPRVRAWGHHSLAEHAALESVYALARAIHRGFDPQGSDASKH